ncbi:hypothetical protein [Agreia sp. Leaf283]|uniref:hypothetical protein n=1 Tax=Agreia sp. Leaf283 TaxID=1736321 RepID=UPI0012FA8A71|nr:hypothetical protein [Agreia sp. Leaf283]
MSEINLLETPIRYGPGERPLYELINLWAYEVLTYRDIALGEGGHNPRNRWAQDFVGALHIRQAIGRAVSESDLARLPVLQAVDTLHLQSTEPDDKRVLRLLEPYYDQFISNPSWWWWTRFPSTGAVFEEAVGMK